MQPILVPRWRFTAAGLSLLAALALGACSDEPLAPRSQPGVPLPGASLATEHVADGETFSNARKYRDNSIRNATGRDGAATLTARALLGRDGVVDLEVTTGALDVRTAPPGNLDRVQVKGIDSDGGEALWTVNHNRLAAGGAWAARYAGLARGSEVQVQANVSGVDPDRVGVITLVERTKRRPDVAVTAIVAPGRAVPNTPVNIGATVRELNGDVGARGDCSLWVDGTEVDRTPGIWVDAGGTVSCAFTHVFAATGTRRLMVAVRGVVPGDWDTANNTRTDSVVVAYPSHFHYSAGASDMTLLRRGADTLDISWSRTSGQSGFLRRGASFENAGRIQSAQHYGWMDTEVAFPLSRLEVSHASSGATLGSIVRSGVAAQYGWSYADGPFTTRYACAQKFVMTPSAGRLNVQLCSGHWSNGSMSRSWTDFGHWRWAGDVTYRSRGYEHVRYPDYWSGTMVEYRYEWNHSGRNATGVPLPALGSTYTMELGVTGADGRSYASQAVVDLQPVRWSYTQPYTCRDASYSWGDYTQSGRWCYGFTDSRQGVAGWTWGAPTATP